MLPDIELLGKFKACFCLVEGINLFEAMLSKKVTYEDWFQVLDNYLAELILFEIVYSPNVFSHR